MDGLTRVWDLKQSDTMKMGGTRDRARPRSTGTPAPHIWGRRLRTLRTGVKHERDHGRGLGPVPRPGGGLAPSGLKADSYTNKFANKVFIALLEGAHSMPFGDAAARLPAFAPEGVGAFTGEPDGEDDVVDGRSPRGSVGLRLRPPIQALLRSPCLSVADVAVFLAVPDSSEGLGGARILWPEPSRDAVRGSSI